jgi:hypothetical protein
MTGGRADKAVFVQPRSRGFSLRWLEPFHMYSAQTKHGWLKPNIEKPRERGSARQFITLKTCRKRQAYYRCAGSPVNGAVPAD